MKLKEQRLGSWISLMLLDLGVLSFAGRRSFCPHCGAAFEGPEETNEKGPLA